MSDNRLIQNVDGRINKPVLKGVVYTPDWIVGPQGPQGPKGEPGKTPVKGVDYFTEAEIKEIEDTVAENVAQGAKGEDGKSAYELAVENGFVGTEEQWLASLVGPIGPVGPQGEPGVPGKDGNNGKDGTNGVDGFSPTAQVYVVEGGAELTVTDRAGTTTAKILNGEKGADGKNGANGKDGFSPTVKVKTSSSEEYILTITDVDGSYDTPNLKGSGSGGGGTGENGATFTPSVSPDGVISWTNDKGYTNPDPVNIKGPQGEKGEKGDKGDTGATGATGPQGIPGEKGDKGEQGAQGIPGEQGPVGPAGPAGQDGAKGEKGDKGDPGQDGKTPVKGVDYWTTADQESIVADVLAALPTAEGVSF